MIIGVGIDIIEVDRVAEKILSGNGFRDRVFSALEIGFCESKSGRVQHYAARFAAKEAFLKAAGIGLTASYDLHEIEVTTDELGKPSITLKGNFLTLGQEKAWNKIHLSISHVQAVACAVVILEQ